MNHPVFHQPTPQQATAWAMLCERQGRRLTVMKAWEELEAARLKRISEEKRNPLTHGWEPPIWRVCDALLGLDWAIPTLYGADYAPRMRRLLTGRNKPVRVLQINGGNRSGKTTYAAKRSLQCMMHFDHTNVWVFHTDGDMSRAAHQPIFWHFIPNAYKPKRQLKTEVAYITYKQQTGFSESSFILPNGSRCELRNYQQDKNKIEGGELGAAVPLRRTDELFEECLGFVTSEHVPYDWIETLDIRLATRSAHAIVEFTPTNGYSDAVKMFQEGMRVTRRSTAWLLPKTLAPPDVERAMVVEDCDRWIEDDPGQRSEVGGRRSEFEQLPRVAVCANADMAVVWFHSSDNPYGNPREVWSTIQTKHTAFKRERFYGMADRQQAGAFPLFNDKVHVVPPSAIPRRDNGKGQMIYDGTIYQVVDPCPGRNFFWIYVLATADGRHFVIDEWPNRRDPVPGIGIMGEWAINTGSRKHDGGKGPAQAGLGWSFWMYKREMARIEGWDCYTPDAGMEDVKAWDQWGPKKLPVFERSMDSRFGNNPLQTGEVVRTIFDEFDDLGLTFQETSSGKRAEMDNSIQMVNDALYYNPEQPRVAMFNDARLKISERCENLIFSMKVWTNTGGGDDPVKDPADCMRYYMLRECKYAAPSDIRRLAGKACY